MCCIDRLSWHSNSDIIVRRSEVTLRAISDISHRGKTASVFADHRQCLTANVAKLPETILGS
jgi:hypothetical protein